MHDLKGGIALNRKRLLLIIITMVVLIAMSLTACGDNNVGSADPGAISKDVQDLLDIAIPNLESKLGDGKVTQEVMDDIIAQIKNGDISNRIQLMAKMAPYL